MPEIVFPIYEEDVKKFTQIKLTNIPSPETLLSKFRKQTYDNGHYLYPDDTPQKLKIVLNPQFNDEGSLIRSQESMSITIQVYRIAGEEEGTYIVDFTRKEGKDLSEFYQFVKDSV